MKVESSTRTIVAILGVVAVAILFWVLLLAPKRDEASKLSTELEGLQSTLVQAQGTLTDAEAARREFPANYHQLIVLGKAVPAGDDTSSLLVQVNRIADEAGVDFESIQLGTANGSATTESPTAAATPAGSAPSVTPTEAEAALLPLGANVGPAGLGVMPYDLIFSGSFFDIADFIKGIDSLVDTGGSKVAVDGRLVTLDGFTLSEGAKGFPDLVANFSVTTYVVPPDQGLTAGATPTGPAEVTEEVEPTEEVESTEAPPTEETEGTPSSSSEELK